MIYSLYALHSYLTSVVSRLTDGWFLGLLARFVFAAVLFMYFFNSALTKFDGSPFAIADAAYFQIVPPIVEAAGYDASQVAFFPWGLMVYGGSYGEVILPILVVIGLWTRIAAVGMIVFVFVQSYVDITFHGVDATTIGAWFDNLSNAAILDQRALWVFLLIYLALKGPGAISLDYLLGRRFRDEELEFAR
ncbi:MAG: DoxX family protein [Pseudomonadota bacterium]